MESFSSVQEINENNTYEDKNVENNDINIEDNNTGIEEYQEQEELNLIEEINQEDIEIIDIIEIEDKEEENQEDNEDKEDNEEEMEEDLKPGLFNSGNTCFINSTLQCLSVSPFINQFIKKYANEDSIMIKCINKYGLGKLKIPDIPEFIKKILTEHEKYNIQIDEFNILNKIAKNTGDIFIYICFKEIMQVLQQKQTTILNCKTFLLVAKEISQSSGFQHLFTGEQNDPHEFMAFLLDKIHNAKSCHVNIEIPPNIDDIYKVKYLEHFKARYQNDFSLFVKNLYYYILNIVECNSCKHQSIEVSPSDIICVPLPDSWLQTPIIKLEDCIHQLFNVEDISYKCEKCNNTNNNKLDKKILTKPKTLIIKLKRYTQYNGNLVKVNKMIQYPEILDISSYYCGSGLNKFKLYGVINHIGSLGGGHYYSYVRDFKENDEFGDIWYLCNDSNTRKMQHIEVMNSVNAYILFYHSLP